MAQGWISIHRQLQSHWLWDDKPFSKGQAWIDLLLLANHADKKVMLGNELIEVQAGSFITSELKLMERWGWSKTKVRAFLDVLQKDKMIVKKSDRKKTTITIENYGLYQDSETTEKPRKDRKKTTKRPPKDTNNNDNNDNNENKIIYVDNPALNQAIISFVSFREKIKKPMTEEAIRLLIEKLQKLTPDVEKQIEIINQSIVNGWQGVFPLKEEKPQQPRQQKSGRKEPVPGWMNKPNQFHNFDQREYDYKDLEQKFIEQVNQPKTAGNDEEVKRKAEELQKKLGVS